jgi:hypothetical protein
VTLNELKNILKACSQAGQTQQVDGFKEFRSRKWHTTREVVRTPKKATLTPVLNVATSNFFALLWTAQVDTDVPVTEAAAPAPEKSGRPLPVILTSVDNLIQLQKHLKGVAHQTFEFRNNMKGTTIVTEDMVDYQAVKSYFGKNFFSYYTFYLKSAKPIKAVVRQLPSNTTAQDISDGQVVLDFDVISVKQLIGSLNVWPHLRQM